VSSILPPQTSKKKIGAPEAERREPKKKEFVFSLPFINLLFKLSLYKNENLTCP
jgi:hypothetical protein